MDGWISINRWRDFQHYDPRTRGLPWIKNYVRILSSDEYLDLSEHRALMLHRLWLEYASTGCRLRLDTARLSRRLSMRVTRTDIEALNHAGFITIVASKALAEGYQTASEVASTEVEVDREEEKTVTVTQPWSKTTGAGEEDESGDGDGDDWDEGAEEEQASDDEVTGFDIPTLEQRPNLEGDNGMGRLSPEDVLAAARREAG